MALKNQKDHWAFLEEIEAPMWVDLISETNLSSQDIDDKWFQTSHLFHQCSSSQLKLAFSCSGEEGVTLELDLVGANSPTLPQSVSRSRGKDFRSKKWKGNCCDVSLNKIESMKVLKGKSLVYGEGIKPKLSFINLKGTSRCKTNLVSEITENAKGKNVKPVSSRGGPERSLSPVVDKSGETNGRSTVTFESIQQQQQKFLEVSSRGFGQTSELLTSVRSSLRKSCITRPASRVEINADRSHRMESRDSRSSSGKSSVGSSSYSGYEAKRSTVSWIKRKEKTPDSRNVAQLTEVAKTKVKPSNMCKKSNVRDKEGERNSRTGGLVTVTKKTWEEAIKSKANSQTHRSKLSLLHKVNEQKPLAGARKASEKEGVGNKVTDAGKENNAGEIPLSQKCSGQGKATEGMVAGRKGATQSTSAKGGKPGMVVPKGRVVNQREGKNPTNLIPKVHFR